MFQRNPYDDFDHLDEYGRPKKSAPAGIQVTPPDPRRPYQLQQDQGQAAAAPYAAPRAAADLTRTQQQIQSQPLQNEQTRASIQSSQQSALSSEQQRLLARQNAEQDFGQKFRSRPEAQSFSTIAQQYGSALRAAKTDNKAADLDLINAYAKILDPGSVVRESEAASAADVGGVQERLKGYFSQLQGGGRLTPEQRSEIVGQIRNRASSAADQYRLIRQQAGDAAKQYGYDPERALGPNPAQPFQQLEADYFGHPIKNGNEMVNPQGYQPRGEHMDATQRQAMTPQAQMQMSDGTTKAQVDPMREAINRRLGAMMTRGASDDKIRAYAAKVGVDPASLTGALQFRRTPGFQQWKRQNPNTAYPVIDPSANVQTSGMERGIAEIAASPIGSGLAHSANAMLAGNLPTLAGGLGADPDRARLNLQTMAEANPKASLAGDIAGTAAAYAGGNAAIGKLGASAAGKFLPQFIKEAPEAYHALSGRALLGDAAYGAANGYGSTGDAMGALEGGASGMAGGALGRGITRGIGNAISPTGGKAAQLYAMGVRPSPGQRFGGILNNIEQRLQDVPVFGDFIRGTRQRARDQFEHGVYNDALKEIGEQLPKGTELGTHAQAYMQSAFDKAYDKARSGMAFVADDEFNQGVTQLLAHAKAGGLDAAAAKRLDNIYKSQIARRAKDGVASGSTYKVMSSQIGKIAAGAQDQEFKGAVRELGDLLDQAARRHSPKDAVDAMDAADAGYAKAVRIEDAAKRRGTDTGRFTPKQYDAAVQNMSSGVRSRDYLAGRALNTDVAQSGKMLSDTISDSGTPQRMLNAMGASAIAGGAAYAHPATLGVLGTVGAAYAPGMRNLTTEALAPRASEAAKKAGGFFRGRRLNRGTGFGGASFADWLDEQRQR